MNEKQLVYLRSLGYKVQEQRTLCALDAGSGNTKDFAPNTAMAS